MSWSYVYYIHIYITLYNTTHERNIFQNIPIYRYEFFFNKNIIKNNIVSSLIEFQCFIYSAQRTVYFPTSASIDEFNLKNRLMKNDTFSYVHISFEKLNEDNSRKIDRNGEKKKKERTTLKIRRFQLVNKFVLLELLPRVYLTHCKVGETLDWMKGIYRTMMVVSDHETS